MCLLVYITLPFEKDAVEFAEKLVHNQLAAGINILGPANSVYSWQGEICKSREWILIAQVSGSAFEKFKEAVAAEHPYEVPCIIGMPITQGNRSFLDWIAQNSITDKK